MIVERNQILVMTLMLKSTEIVQSCVFKRYFEDFGHVTMLQFQYNKVSHGNTTFSTFRGIKVLSALFQHVQKHQDSDQKQSSFPIHLVSTVHGHLAVSFHDGRQFVVFDAVPRQLLLSDIEQTKLLRFVLKEVNDYLKNILAMKTQSHVVHLSFLNPSPPSRSRIRARPKPNTPKSGPSNTFNANKSNTNPNVNKMNRSNVSSPRFNAQPIARKLQLLAVHSDGGLIIWNWNQIRYLWHYKIRKILPSPYSDAQSRAQYMANIHSKLYEKERPGILAFCAVITTPPHLVRIPCLKRLDADNEIQSASERRYITAFENLLYPERQCFFRGNAGSVRFSDTASISSRSATSGQLNYDGALYFLMVDYAEDSVQSDLKDIHRYLLHRQFPGIKTKERLSTQFKISMVRLDVDYGNVNAPMMSGGTMGMGGRTDQSKVCVELDDML